MARPIIAMVTDETRAILQPHVDEFAERLPESIAATHDPEMYAWGAILSAFARSLECGDNSIVWADT